MPYNTWNTGYQYAPTYNPYYQQNTFQPTPMQGQQGQAVQPQIQSGGFIRVQNENEARMYPVAPGNSVTFIDESNPYCYVKTMGFSQLDTPKFEKYRLVKEEIAEEIAQQAVQSAENTQPSQEMAILDALRGQFEILRADVDKLKAEIEKPVESNSTRSVKVRKREDENDG